MIATTAAEALALAANSFKVSWRRVKPSLFGAFHLKKVIQDIGRFAKRGHDDGIDPGDVAEHVYQG